MANSSSSNYEMGSPEREEEEEEDYDAANGGDEESGAAGASSGTGSSHGVKRQKTHKPPPDALQHKFKPFVQAAFDMVSNPANHSSVRFSEDGTAVEIIDVGAFSDKVLPKYFKHKNISSFIRQMNMYGFEKIAEGSEGAIHTFKHEFFKRDQPQLLSKILRKPVKGHRKPGQGDSEAGDEDVAELLETKRAEASRAVDELARLKQAQARHEERLRQLERDNEHLTEENQRIRGAVVQVKAAQAAMTDRLRRLFIYFMRYYVRDEKAFGETVRNLLENANAGPGESSMTEPQRQVINQLFRLEDDPANAGMALLKAVPEDELTRSHSLASTGGAAEWLASSSSSSSAAAAAAVSSVDGLLPSKPRVDESSRPEYATLARDLASHIDQNDQTLRRIDTLASELQDVDPLLSGVGGDGDDDDLFNLTTDQSLLRLPSNMSELPLTRLPSTTSISGPLPDEGDDDDLDGTALRRS